MGSRAKLNVVSERYGEAIVPSSSGNRQSCIATASVLLPSIACYGGYEAIPICLISRPIRMLRQPRRWRRPCIATCTGCKPPSASAKSAASRKRIMSHGTSRNITSWKRPRRSFARRFADMPWSILTPEVCAHWDGHAVAITSGIEAAEAPGPDRLEETWWRHCASISIRRG